MPLRSSSKEGKELEEGMDTKGHWKRKDSMEEKI
jgi:hypothetical protein